MASSSITTSSFWDNKIWKHNGRTYVNLPVGMTEHTEENSQLLLGNNNDHYTEFVMNVLYRLDPTYLEEMEEWDPRSEISMFNDWDGSGEHLPLLEPRELCEKFEKLMVRYVHVEHMLHKLKTKRENNNKVSLSTDKKTCSSFIALLLICVIYMMALVTLIWNTDMLSLANVAQENSNSTNII